MIEKAGSRASVAVLGGRGMLGADLVAALRRAGYAATPFDLPECDVTRERDVALALADVQAVINCAAFTNVDGAESAPEAARAVNAEAPGRIGRLAAQRRIYVLHVSTDFVFDGTQDRPYRETDKPRPVSVYGATKLAGEEAVLASGCRGAVVRVQWTYGQSGNHFIGKFLARALARDDLLMVSDQIGSPTWTQDVSAAFLDLLGARMEGLFHYAAAGYATRFDVARAILELRGLSGKRLTPCRTADFPAAARRPLNSRFDCAKIDAVLASPRPHWRDSLARFLRAWEMPSADKG